MTMVAPSSMAKLPESVAREIVAPKSDRRVGVVLQAEILGDDAGVPCAARRRDQSGDQVGKDPRQDQRPPALPALKLEQRRPSFRSVGIAIAPAMTLNRMYHCVPSSSSTIEPMPSPPPTRISTSSTIGKQRRRRNGRRNLRQRLRDAGQPGMKPMATPTGIVQSAADEQRTHSRAGRSRPRPRGSADLRRTCSCRRASCRHGMQSATISYHGDRQR